jgi:hypothetical protein
MYLEPSLGFYGRAGGRGGKYSGDFFGAKSPLYADFGGSFVWWCHYIIRANFFC